nr:hypothetical protein [Tanacetum cinerariifolium]GFB83829.1 hypothetical protein [Tanacetum cinerariifolium]
LLLRSPVRFHSESYHEVSSINQFKLSSVSSSRLASDNLEEQSRLIVTMTDNRTMAELLRATIEGYAEAIVVPPILAEQFEIKHSLINMMTTDQFFRLEKDNPHDHIRWGSPPVARKRTPAFYYYAWDRYKDLLRACPHHGFTELHKLDTFYNALNPADQDSLNAAVGGNLLKRSTQDVLTIIENKYKVHNFRSKPIASQIKACDVNSNSSEIAKLTHAVNQQTNVVTTAMMAILKQFQANPTPAPGELKAITTRSGLVIDGPTIPTHSRSINLEEDARVEE